MISTTRIDSLDDATVRAWALALVFAAGASLALVSASVTRGPGMNMPAEAFLGATGYVLAAVLIGLGRKTSEHHIRALLVADVVMVGVGVYFTHGGPTGASAAFFYVWAALYAGLFLSVQDTVQLLGLAAASYSVVLALAGGTSAPVQAVLVMGTAVVAAVVAVVAARRLRSAATIDALTGLPNRAAAERTLRLELARAARHHHELAVALVDLDGLKQINDRLGHQAGDRALLDSARHWRHHLRQVDLVARLGGDEFLVVMPATPGQSARRALERMVLGSAHRYSVGLAEARADDAVESVLARADRALYAAKARGGGCVVSAAAAKKVSGVWVVLQDPKISRRRTAVYRFTAPG